MAIKFHPGTEKARAAAKAAPAPPKLPVTPVWNALRDLHNNPKRRLRLVGSNGTTYDVLKVTIAKPIRFTLRDLPGVVAPLTFEVRYVPTLESQYRPDWA